MLSAAQRKQLGDLAGLSGIDLLLQFGSTVSGKTHAASDLDVAVRFVGQYPDRHRLGSFMQALQAIVPDREVDVSLINGADPLHLFKICEACVLLHGNPRDLCELKLLAFKRYQDHRRFFAMEAAFVDRFLEKRGGHR